MKKLLTLALAGSIALSLISCNNVSDYSEAGLLAAVNETNSTVKMEEDEVSMGSATIYSDLNPGYGYAVYFAGTFSNDWGTAYRGTYSENNGWHLNLATEESFEWKALTGSYDLGEEVSISFEGLTYLGETFATGSNPNPSWWSNVGYGNALFFVGNKNPSLAVRGTYDTDHWTTEGDDVYSRYSVYAGAWDLGESVQGTFKGLTWETGDNNVYKYDGYNPVGDGIVNRRALAISLIDNSAVCIKSINAITNALSSQTFDGKAFVTVNKYTDLSKAEISNAFKNTFADADGDDVSYIFLNGHGSSSGYVRLATDGSLSGANIRTLLDKYVPGHVVVLLETCHAGVIIGRGEDEKTFADSFISNFKAEESDSRSGELADTRFHVLCSSLWEELSWSLAGVIGYASDAWAKGLGRNERADAYTGLLADLNSDRKVTVEELYNYSKDLISSKQTVVVYPDYDEFVIGGKY